MGGNVVRIQKFRLILCCYSGLLPLNRTFLLLTERVESLRRERARTAGIVATDHNYRSILSISDRLFLLRDGQTIPVRDREHLSELGYLPPE